MTFTEKLNLVCRVFKAVVLKKKVPLMVTWCITYRCNLKCNYCGAWRRNAGELNTSQVYEIIDELEKLGAKFIKFSGGEPLLRDDIGEIISYCRKRGLIVLLNSNGTLVCEKLKEIGGIEEIQISLDGPESVHDYIRGKGTYNKVIQALESLKGLNINVVFTTVISKYNIEFIPFILELAEKYKVGAYFQPVTQDMSNGCGANVFSEFAPDIDGYRKAIGLLIKEKRKGNHFILHSMSGLRHLYCWPIPRSVNCIESLVCCFMEPDSSMFVCNMFPHYERYLVNTHGRLKENFLNLSLPHPCTECWASDVELNLLGKFKLDAMWGIWKRFCKNK